MIVVGMGLLVGGRAIPGAEMANTSDRGDTPDYENTPKSDGAGGLIQV